LALVLVVVVSVGAVNIHGTCKKEQRAAGGQVSRRPVVSHSLMSHQPNDCCEDECAWTPPAPCECCGCALQACLCCDSPAETCNETEYQGEPTFACVVDITTESFGACKQECSNGDWTAAIGSVGAFYAKRAVDCHLDQCQVASLVSGHDCCDSNVTCRADCNLAITWDDMATILKKRIPQHSFQSDEGSLSAQDLSTNLEKRSPVIAVMAPSSHQVGRPFMAADIHTVVVLGYHGYLWEAGQIAFEFLVADSASDAPEWIAYDDLVSYKGATWAYSAY